MKYFSDEYLAEAAKTPRLKSYSETFKENYLKRRAVRMQKQYVTVNGVGVYYDFGADYYFFTDEARGE